MKTGGLSANSNVNGGQMLAALGDLRRCWRLVMHKQYDFDMDDHPELMKEHGCAIAGELK